MLSLYGLKAPSSETKPSELLGLLNFKPPEFYSSLTSTILGRQLNQSVPQFSLEAI